ncbi:MAG: hypothetical protein K9H25_20070, partial [Rhodospirillum sp.]|nr:hypothetical protein [Rhodospirillum sp.]MCF8491475.1 hypothetical protein [Rhodospirillum sp.]MCF8499783.1 hypothetical protein [Rhodospirillum sp.]
MILFVLKIYKRAQKLRLYSQIALNCYKVREMQEFRHHGPQELSPLAMRDRSPHGSAEGEGV